MNFEKYRNEFWEYIDKLVESSEIIIDRPKGSVHPRFNDIIYPLDYGYLNNTKSKDDNEIDVWIGSSSIKKVDSILCIIDLMKKDSEIKILYSCSDEEKELIYEFQNNKFMKAVMIIRWYGTITDNTL